MTVVVPTKAKMVTGLKAEEITPSRYPMEEVYIVRIKHTHTKWETNTERDVRK
jgi:hypothetical protein